MVLVAGMVLLPAMGHAASCCGGGSASSLVLPKFARSMVDVSFDYERYNGFWDHTGNWIPDPQGADLNQYRLNTGFAYRLANRWQGSISVPYVWNQNQYSGLTRNTQGLGDSKISLWYEAFDAIKCVWRVDKPADLMPAVYWGGSLTIPTGTSPFDDVGDNFDTTGRGFYRLDGSVLLDKTIYPWNASLLLTYGSHLRRPVNQEFGNQVAPYHKRLGDRASGSLALGYTYFTDEMHSITGTVAYADLWEDKATIDGETDPTSGLRKRSVSGTVAWATPSRDWVTKFTVSHAIAWDNWGYNFPTTDIFTVGLSRVFR